MTSFVGCITVLFKKKKKIKSKVNTEHLIVDLVDWRIPPPPISFFRGGWGLPSPPPLFLATNIFNINQFFLWERDFGVYALAPKQAPTVSLHFASLLQNMSTTLVKMFF